MKSSSMIIIIIKCFLSLNVKDDMKSYKSTSVIHPITGSKVGVSNPWAQTSTSPWPVRNWTSQQEVSGGWASGASSAFMALTILASLHELHLPSDQQGH